MIAARGSSTVTETSDGRGALTSLRKFPITAAALTAAMVILPVQAAEAAEIQYALNSSRTELQRASSAPATVKGGRGYVSGTGPNMVVETVDADSYVRLYFAVAQSGGPVSFTHGSQGNARSRCFWDWPNASVAGSLLVNCWRTY